MSNKRHVVELSDSTGQTYTLRFGTNAICAVQDELNLSLGEILKQFDHDKLDMRTIRTMVKCAVVEPKGVTAEQVGDFIDDVGFEAVTKVIGTVFGSGEAGPPGGPSGGDSKSNAPHSA